jgi:hypothetical protein
MFALVTASQMASASAASFFCRLSHPAIERAMLIALSKRRTQR